MTTHSNERRGFPPPPGPPVLAAPSADSGDGEATRSLPGRDLVARPPPAASANSPVRTPTEVVPGGAAAGALPGHPPTEVVAGEALPGHPPTEAVASEAVPDRPATDVVQFGPGVPATVPGGQAESAERVWRTGGLTGQGRRRLMFRRLAGWALTVVLLAASGVVLYLRFHHPPFHVTGVVVSQQARSGCGLDVTGRIAMNGSAGTVWYQWLFSPDQQAPQPLSQSVVAGQRAVYVTVAVQGSGHGTASRTVTLQVLGPDHRATSAAVVLSC